MFTYKLTYIYFYVCPNNFGLFYFNAIVVAALWNNNNNSKRKHTKKYQQIKPAYICASDEKQI